MRQLFCAVRTNTGADKNTLLTHRKQTISTSLSKINQTAKPSNYQGANGSLAVVSTGSIFDHVTGPWSFVLFKKDKNNGCWQPPRKQPRVLCHLVSKIKLCDCCHLLENNHRPFVILSSKKKQWMLAHP